MTMRNEVFIHWYHQLIFTFSWREATDEDLGRKSTSPVSSDIFPKYSIGLYFIYLYNNVNYVKCVDEDHDIIKNVQMFTL